MDDSLSKMLTDIITSAHEAEKAAIALGESFAAALPFKIGDDVQSLTGGQRFKVDSIKFEMRAYMKHGAWLPGYAAMGRVLIGSMPGSTTSRAVFDLSGRRVILG